MACLCGALACAQRASRRRQAVLTLALGIGANTAMFGVVGIEAVERVTGAYVSSGFFPVFGVTPFLGRTFRRPA